MRRLAFVLVALIACAAPALAASPLDELRRSFTLDGKPVPPDVFRDFGDADLGDSLPAVVTIDVKAAINSNRYGFPIARRGGLVTQSRPAIGSLNGAEETGYRYVGATKNGLPRRHRHLTAAAAAASSPRCMCSTRASPPASTATASVTAASISPCFAASSLGDRWQGEATIAGDTVRIVTAMTAAEGVPKSIEAKRP